MKTAVVFLYFMKILLCTADGDLLTSLDYYLSQTQLILEFRGNLPHLWAIYMEGGKTEHQKDPTGRIILAPYIFCIQFTCKESFLVLGSSSTICKITKKVRAL